MENRINIAELLKDCPKGMELDCVLFNNPVRYDGLDNDDNYPIIILTENDDYLYLTEEGYLYNMPNSKCVIFPKGKTTWEGFHRPFKDGDIKSGKYYLCIRNLFDELDNIIFHKGDTYYSPEDGKLIPSNSNIPYEVCCVDEYFRAQAIQNVKIDHCTETFDEDRVDSPDINGVHSTAKEQNSYLFCRNEISTTYDGSYGLASFHWTITKTF